MKTLSVLALTAAALASARSVDVRFDQHLLASLGNEQPLTQDRCLIELSPGETRWVAEDEKWELKKVSLSANGTPDHC